LIEKERDRWINTKTERERERERKRARESGHLSGDPLIRLFCERSIVYPVLLQTDVVDCVDPPLDRKAGSGQWKSWVALVL